MSTSTTRTGTVPMPSIQSVVAGLHEDGDTVTVTGVLNNLHLKRTKQGNDWATCILLDGNTAVDVTVLPLPYQQHRDVIGPVRGSDKSLLPPTVTVTGRVDHRDCVPGLVASALQCHGHDEHGPHPEQGGDSR
jgi:DNA polymerase III alpha subunit